MLTLHINDKDYHIEFTFEAALSDCVNKAFDIFSGANQIRALQSVVSKGKSEDSEEAQMALIDNLISDVCATGRDAVEFLYYGLMEHHGIDGDETQDITSFEDARRLYKAFCKQNPDDTLTAPVELFKALRNEMEEGGFFNRIGLTEFLESQEQTTEKIVKTQDHKKSTKTSKK